MMVHVRVCVGFVWHCVEAYSKPPCRIQASIEVLGFYIRDGSKKVRDHFKLSLMGNFELWVKLARKKNELKRERDR
jgi:hypothetical protein